MNENQSVKKAMAIINCLIQYSFTGMSVNEICDETDFPRVTVWRILQTLKTENWVIETMNPGENEVTWKLGNYLINVSRDHKLNALNEINSIKEKYFKEFGKELQIE